MHVMYQSSHNIFLKICKNRHDITEIFQTDPISDRIQIKYRKNMTIPSPIYKKIKLIIIKKRANNIQEAEEGEKEKQKSSRNPPFLKARGGSERSPRHCIQAKDKTRKDRNRKRGKKTGE